MFWIFFSERRQSTLFHSPPLPGKTESIVWCTCTEWKFWLELSGQTQTHWEVHGHNCHFVLLRSLPKKTRFSKQSPEHVHTVPYVGGQEQTEWPVDTTGVFVFCLHYQRKTDSTDVHGHAAQFLAGLGGWVAGSDTAGRSDTLWGGVHGHKQRLNLYFVFMTKQKNVYNRLVHVHAHTVCFFWREKGNHVQTQLDWYHGTDWHGHKLRVDLICSHY